MNTPPIELDQREKAARFETGDHFQKKLILNDHEYFHFENRFRGSREDIQNRQRTYIPTFQTLLKRFSSDDYKIIDIGCGRGEFIELLQSEGISVKGIDINRKMVALCRERGLDAEAVDAMEYLTKMDNESIAGVIACQFIEHLSPSEVHALLYLLFQKLKKGGCAVFETINPESLFAMKWFYLDLTHEKPIHPEALRFLMESVGFRDIEIKYLSPVPESQRLCPAEDKNMEKLDSFLFGYQDYALIATKPRE